MCLDCGFGCFALIILLCFCCCLGWFAFGVIGSCGLAAVLVIVMGVWLRCLCLVAWCVGCMYCDYCVGWFGRFGLVAGIGWLVGLGLVVCLWLAGGFLCLLVWVYAYGFD